MGHGPGAVVGLADAAQHLANGKVALTAADAITTLFDYLGIADPSPATRARFEAWYTSANTSTNGWSIRGNALMIGLVSPDFQLA